MTIHRSISLHKALTLSVVALLCGGCSMPTFYDRPSWSLFDKTETAQPSDTRVATGQVDKREPYALGAATGSNPDSQ